MKSIIIFIVLESMYTLNIGIMKGLGKLNMSVLWSIVSYYLLGLPLAFFFAFYARSVLQWQNSKIFSEIHGLSGLYFGFNIAVLILNILIANEMFSHNWQDTCKQLQTTRHRYNQNQATLRFQESVIRNMSSHKQSLGNHAKNFSNMDALSFRNATAGASPVLGDVYNKDLKIGTTLKSAGDTSAQDLLK